MTAHELTPRDDLHWLAFCYVAGELSAAEATAFEARLATDESACEAVTLAMQTCGAVVLACDSTQARWASDSALARSASDSTLARSASDSTLARSASEGQTENHSADYSLAPRVCVSLCPVDGGRPSRWSSVAIAALAGTAITAACVALSLGLFRPAEEQVARRDGTERLVAAWVHGEAVRNDFDDDPDALDVADDDLDPPDWMLAAVSADELTKRIPGEPLDDVQEN